MQNISAEQLDTMFDNGEDMTEYLNLASVRPVNVKLRRVSLDVPAWMVQAIDAQANLLGVSRQAYIKFALNEKLEAMRQQ